MRKIIFLGLAVISLQLNAQQNSNDLNDLAHYNLKGGIKKIHQKIYSVKIEDGMILPDKIEPGHVYSVDGEQIDNENFLITANNQRKLNQVSIYSGMGKNPDDIDFQSNFTYDSQGNLIESKTFGNHLDGRFSYLYRYNYDSQGNLKMKKRYNSYGQSNLNAGSSLIEWDSKNKFEMSPDFIAIYFYNPENLLIQLQMINCKRKEVAIKKYQYTSQSYCKEIIYYPDSTRKQFEKSVFKYDSLSRLVSEIHYEHDSCMFEITKTYSDEQKKHMVILHENGKMLTKVFNEFNDLTAEDSCFYMIKTNISENGEKIFSLTIQYIDPNNNLVDFYYSSNTSDFVKELEGLKLIYNYEYDRYGNWTKRITYQNGIPKKLALRDIEYY